MDSHSLYIDHQALAPLIHSLQDTVALSHSHQPRPLHRSQLRLPIYQQFLSILHTLYNSQFAQIKLEHLESKLQDPAFADFERKEIEVGGMGLEKWDRENEENGQLCVGGRIRTRATRTLQIEIELVQWMISCNKNIFDKREIAEKHAELAGSSKKLLSLSKIMVILEKYKLKNVIVRGKNGEEHFLRYDPNTDTSTVIKRQEFSREMSRFMHKEEVLINEAVWGQLADPVQEHQDELEPPYLTSPVVQDQEQMQDGDCEKKQ